MNSKKCIYDSYTFKLLNIIKLQKNNLAIHTNLSQNYHYLSASLVQNYTMHLNVSFYSGLMNSLKMAHKGLLMLGRIFIFISIIFGYGLLFLFGIR